MKQGRPPRSDENPDSAFGVLLKDYLRRINMTQRELARLTLLKPEVITRMVKGDREKGTAFRRDLRAIIKVLHEKKALSTVNEANALITTIPTAGMLDQRDAEDAEIIQLLQSSQELSKDSAGEAGLVEELHEQGVVPSITNDPPKTATLSGSVPRRRVLLSLTGFGVVVLAADWYWLSRSRVSGNGTNKEKGSTQHDTQVAGVGTWQTTSSMAIKRVYHSATLMPDGSVLVAAGRYTDADAVDFTEVYHPIENNWVRRGSLRLPRLTVNNSLVTLSTGKALLAGGSNPQIDIDDDTVELYDVITGTWTPTGKLNIPRRMAALAVLNEKQVLIIGGAHGPPDGNRFLASTEIYDVDTGKWTLAAPLHVRREVGGILQLQNGRIMIAGGEGPHQYVYTDIFELFDPTTRAWSPGGKMPWGWVGATMTLLSDGSGRVLVAGGLTKDNIYSKAALYNPHTNEWKLVHPMATARVGHIAIPLADGRVLIAGGNDFNNTFRSSEVYDPVHDRWSTGPSLYEARTASRVVLLPNGNALVTGGINDLSATEHETLNSCELFIPGQQVQE